MTQPPQSTLPIPDPEVIDFAYQRIIEFGVIGCAFVVVFIAFLSLIWWVMKSSATTIKDMRASEKNAHESSRQTSEKMYEVNAKISERLTRVLEMLNSIIRCLSAQAEGRSGNDPPDAA